MTWKKKGQGYQTWYYLLDLKQGYNYAKFERLPLNSFRQKAEVEVLVKSENTSIISLEYVQKRKKSSIFVIYFHLLNNLTNFNSIG